jgi:carboxyl-terminal processing protease
MMLFALLALRVAAKTEDYSKTWDQIDKAIRRGYYARVQRKSTMEELLGRYGPQAKAATSRVQFESIVNHMIHDFRDSHFGFFTESDQTYYLMDNLARTKDAKAMPEFGAWFSGTPDPTGGYTVTMVLEDSEAAKAGLRKGDVVVQVNGQPFTPVDSLKPLVGAKADLTVMRVGTTLHPEVTVSSEKALDMFLDASKASARIIDDNGKKVGYFHLWTQASNDFKSALEGAVYSHLRDTDSFILDLRDGFGGRPEGYGDAFFRPNVWLDWKTSPTSGFKELLGYGRPLVVLINGGSRSAKEVLSYVFKKSGRATLVGQTTAGNVLGTFPQRINDWAYLEIPFVDVLADGIRLEGKGVAPDIAVPVEFDSQGLDLDLKAALGKLKGSK